MLSNTNCRVGWGVGRCHHQTLGGGTPTCHHLLFLPTFKLMIFSLFSLNSFRHLTHFNGLSSSPYPSESFDICCSSNCPSAHVIQYRNSGTTQKLYISQLTTTLSASKNITKNYLWHPTVTGLGQFVLISCSGHSSSKFPSNPPHKNLKSPDGNATKRSIT